MNPLGLKKKKREKELFVVVQMSFPRCALLHVQGRIAETITHSTRALKSNYKCFWFLLVFMNVFLNQLTVLTGVWEGTVTYKNVYFCLQNYHPQPPDWTAAAINDI